MTWMLLACAQGDGLVADEGPEAYVGEPGTYYELGPADDPNGLGWLLEATEGSWTMKEGETWISGTELFSVTAEASKNGLMVGSTQLLPDSVEEGSSGDGVTVVSRGEVTVYYGTFVDAVTVEVGSGDWAGTQVFARDIGPVLLTWQGTQRELRYYE